MRGEGSKCYFDPPLGAHTLGLRRRRMKARKKSLTRRETVPLARWVAHFKGAVEADNEGGSRMGEMLVVRQAGASFLVEAIALYQTAQRWNGKPDKTALGTEAIPPLKGG